jgi:GTP-binding protein Era
VTPNTAPPITTRAGFVALIGLPNAGKSSLLNRLLGQKLSITTAAAQTTRERVVGIDTRDGSQAIYLDTPGVVDPAYLLHRSMLHAIEAAVHDADVVVWVTDAARSGPEIPADFREQLAQVRQPVVVALNKVDLVGEEQMEEARDRAAAVFSVGGYPVSATTGAGLEKLRAAIVAALPESPFLYPEEEVATQSTRFFVAELIRETAFEQYQQEIPYSVAVVIDEFREERSPLYIRATVFVERESQKGILIGRGGGALKQLGREARAKIEAFVGSAVYLDLWVKVLPRWRKDPLSLDRLGFPLPPT